MNTVYGLVGYPIAHSFSPGYFEKKFLREAIQDVEYRLFPCPSLQDILELKQDKTIQGLNVTIPYKEKILEILDEVDPEAKEVGAINTVVCRHGKWKGFNTDIVGFEQLLLPLLFACENAHPEALILGHGGASKAVLHVCRKRGIKTKLVTRLGQVGLRYEELTEEVLESVDFIINTTPVGMYPRIEESPAIPYHMIKKTHFLIDLVYNPKNTLFLTKGLQQGATVKNGMDMLIYQAEKSWEIWNQN